MALARILKNTEEKREAYSDNTYRASPRGWNNRRYFENDSESVEHQQVGKFRGIRRGKSCKMPHPPNQRIKQEVD